MVMIERMPDIQCLFFVSGIRTFVTIVGVIVLLAYAIRCQAKEGACIFMMSSLCLEYDMSSVRKKLTILANDIFQS